MAKKIVQIVRGPRAMAFSPGVVEIAVGDTVEWINTDPEAQHTVTFDGAILRPPVPDSSDQLSLNDVFKAVFPHAGTFGYHCANHPHMKGTVEVTDPITTWVGDL